MTAGRSSVRRVALVGVGGISRSHAAAIAADPRLRLVSLVDTDPGALVQAQEELEVAGYATVEALLAAGETDIACICTPPASHRALAEALLGTDVDVLCEKPLATTPEDAKSMMELAATRGRRLAVSDKFRHVDDLREAGRRVADGEIGTPLSFGVCFCAPVDVRGRWPSDPALSGGGVVMDNGPHALDVLSHVLDAPIVECRGVFGDSRLVSRVEDTAVITFRTGLGTVGRVELSWAYFTKDLDYLVVQGSDGTICVGWTGGRIRRHGEREWEDFGSGYSKADAFAEIWAQFLGPENRGGRWPDPVEALELIRSVYASAGAEGARR